MEKKKKEILPLLIEEGTNDPQKLDLKPLLMELKYAYLEENEQCPVIISCLLNSKDSRVFKVNGQRLKPYAVQFVADNEEIPLLELERLPEWAWFL